MWYNEPDISFHYLEIGSAGSMAALRNADKGLGAIIDWIEAQPDAGDIALVIASDHGQISTSAAVPLFDEAAVASFEIGRSDNLAGKEFAGTTGSSGEIRQLHGNPSRLHALAAWLMQHPAVCHVFSRGRNEVEGEIPGTLALSVVGQTHERSAALLYVLRSDLSLDKYGLPGLGLLMPGDVAVGGGYHGGINPHEINTVLIVSAPGRIAAGAVTHAPAGIIDIAPTVLGLLGVPAAASMQGRNLAQAARGEARFIAFKAGAGGFSQRVNVIEEDGRRIIMDGGQVAS